MKEIKKINVLSVSKILGLSFAIMGFIIGIAVGFVMFVIGSAFDAFNGFTTLIAPGLGIVGFIIIPMIYGLVGFIIGGLSTLIYNILASWIGGIEIEVTEKDEN
jgi:hypothetical protein